MDQAVTVYGTDWCGDCRYTTRHLDRLGVAYEYVNIDHDQDAERKVLEWNAGRRRVPTVVFASSAGESRLSVPDRETLEQELTRHGIGD